MSESNGKHIITSLQRKWQTKVLAALFLSAIAIAIFFAVLLHKIVLLSFWYTFSMLVITLGVLVFLLHKWRISEWEVARFLNQNYPS
ncbi:MAG TPA: hypothetical protein VF610_11855, partial [Segetibacter sp.]